MKRKNYYLIWCVLFIFLIMPFQFGCDKTEDELQPQQTAVTDFDPWIYDFNCNGQIDLDELQAVLDDYTENKINKEEFKAFTDLWISLNNDQEENSEKSISYPCYYDSNSNGKIDINELSTAIDDFYAGSLHISVLSEVMDLFLYGGQCYTKFTVNWYGDQYLEDSERTSSGIQSDVTSAVQAIVNQTNLTDYNVIPHWNSWDSHFTKVSVEGANNDLIDEIVDEKPYGSKCNSILGITYKRATDHNGNAHWPGYYCVADCDPNSWVLVDWPDVTLYMHELCHNLNATHCNKDCVMNYYYAANGTTNICAGCRDDINEYLNN